MNLYFNIILYCNADFSAVVGMERRKNFIFVSAVEQTMRLIDVPQQSDFTVEKVVEQLSVFADQCIVQTMILRGEHDGQPVDNSTPEEIDALIAAYQRIKPREVMLYSIDRSTPEEKLQKVEIDELRVIAARIEQAGIKVQVN